MDRKNVDGDDAATCKCADVIEGGNENGAGAKGIADETTKIVECGNVWRMHSMKDRVVVCCVVCVCG